MSSHVQSSRASAVVLALTLAIATGCDCGSATPSDPAVGSTAKETPVVPVIDAPIASKAPPSKVIAAPMSDAVAPTEPKPAADVAAHKEIVWLKGTLEEALEQAKKQNKLVFIDFWTTWCGWCKKLDHDTYTDPKVIAALEKDYVCLSIDAESKIGAPIARKYSVSGYPTMLFLTTDGLVRERIARYLPPEKLLPFLTQTPKPR